jgi:hypothetical protein
MTSSNKVSFTPRYTRPLKCPKSRHVLGRRLVRLGGCKKWLILDCVVHVRSSNSFSGDEVSYDLTLLKSFCIGAIGDSLLFVAGTIYSRKL